MVTRTEREMDVDVTSQRSVVATVIVDVGTRVRVDLNLQSMKLDKRPCSDGPKYRWCGSGQEKDKNRDLTSSNDPHIHVFEFGTGVVSTGRGEQDRL